jgi:DNA primase
VLTLIDTDALKREHPVEAVITGYGVELRPSGRALVGRCPFHIDGGRPNLHVYPDGRNWFCYRCGIGGDVITFIRRMEGLGFREAVDRLYGNWVSSRNVTLRPIGLTKPRRTRANAWGRDEQACLAAAVELYNNRLLIDSDALHYLDERGIRGSILEERLLGYSGGDELTAYLRWRRLPTSAATRVGLLGRGGGETMAGRIVVPEIRSGQPIWLVGRTITRDVAPRYLGLPGRKPLLGWESASSEDEVYLVEGVFDYLVLRSWEYPALALVGTHVRPAVLDALQRFKHIYLVLDTDEAGRKASHELARVLGSRATEVILPDVKDVAELAPKTDGHAIFARALQQSELAAAA